MLLQCGILYALALWRELDGFGVISCWCIRFLCAWLVYSVSFRADWCVSDGCIVFQPDPRGHPKYAAKLSALEASVQKQTTNLFRCCCSGESVFRLMRMHQVATAHVWLAMCMCLAMAHMWVVGCTWPLCLSSQCTTVRSRCVCR